MEILPQLLINALITGSIYSLVAVGYSLTYGVLKILNFAHGHLMMTGAYIFYLFSIEYGLGLPVAVFLTVASSLLLASLTFSLFIKPFEHYSPLLPLISTLAFATILESLVSIFFGVNVKSLVAGDMAESLELAVPFSSSPIFITHIQIVIIGCAIALPLLLAALLYATSFGRMVRAISELPLGAQSLGIPVSRIRHALFCLSGLLATFAGIMVGYETNLQPTMGHSYLLKGVAASIVGGLGNIWGTLAGCYVLGLVENLSIGLDLGDYSLPAGYKDSFAFFVILIVLLIRPEGLFSPRKRTV